MTLGAADEASRSMEGDEVATERSLAKLQDPASSRTRTRTRNHNHNHNHTQAAPGTRTRRGE